MFSPCWPSAWNRRPEVPGREVIFRPTAPTRAMPSWMRISSGLQIFCTSEIMSYRQLSRAAEDITRAKVSSPRSICSTDTWYRSAISRASRRVSVAVMFRRVTVRMVKFRRPATPVMTLSCSSTSFSTVSTIMVPGSSGQLVLRMFRGMPFSFTGRMESSWRTEAPMKASSRSSAKVIWGMGLGSLTILGSAIRMPDTSVQFSYTSASTAAAASAPDISLPPRDMTLILPVAERPKKPGITMRPYFSSAWAMAGYVFSRSTWPSKVKNTQSAASTKA